MIREAAAAVLWIIVSSRGFCFASGSSGQSSERTRSPGSVPLALYASGSCVAMLGPRRDCVRSSGVWTVPGGGGDAGRTERGERAARIYGVAAEIVDEREVRIKRDGIAATASGDSRAN